MLGIDTNIFLYSLNSDSELHQKACHFLNTSFANTSEPVVLSDYVLVEVYNYLRNVKLMPKALKPQEAVALVTSYWDIPNVVRSESAEVMDKVWLKASESNFARRRIFDVRLALTLQRHGVTRFATANVKDFQNLGFQKVWNPLLESE